MAKVLTQAEFDTIKDLLFQGEEYSDIAQVTGRSVATIGRIERAHTLAAYQTIQKDYDEGRAKHYRPPALNRYQRLAEARQKYDEAMLSFIREEVSERVEKGKTETDEKTMATMARRISRQPGRWRV